MGQAVPEQLFLDWGAPVDSLLREVEGSGGLQFERRWVSKCTNGLSFVYLSVLQRKVSFVGSIRLLVIGGWNCEVRLRDAERQSDTD